MLTGSIAVTVAAALQGQTVDAPAGWPKLRDSLLAEKNPATTDLVNKLSVSFRDPQAFTAFFERVKNLEKRRQNRIAKAFETHPQTPDRITRTQKEINTLLPPQVQYKVDTSDFQDVKAQLNRLENRRNGIENPARPTLRHRPQPEVESKPAGADREPTLISKSENQ